MPFVKLDCRILDSTLWLEREMREVFITALLMAEPFETTVDLPQLRIRSLDTTGWLIPAGRYGLVEAAGVGILRRAGVSEDPGLSALERLGEPELSSRSQDFDGRRLVRIDGGFLVLNFQKYRDRDYTSAQRSARYRQRVIEQRSNPQLVRASRRRVTAERRDITQAEAEAEVDLNLKDLANLEVVAAKGGSGGVQHSGSGGNARSRRPIFTGQRFVVFDWMLEDMGRILGTENLNAFDVHEWFFDLDARVAKTNVVLQRSDVWPWLQSELVREAAKRGLTIAAPTNGHRLGKQTQRLLTALSQLNT